MLQILPPSQPAVPVASLSLCKSKHDLNNHLRQIKLQRLSVPFLDWSKIHFQEVKRLPYGTFDERGHYCNPESAAADDKYFDELSSPFEVLRHHQRRTVSCQAHAHTDHRP